MNPSETSTPYSRILSETARIEWAELERHFAAGRVIKVAASLDLIAVGQALADDRADQLRRWMQAQQVGQLDDETARAWSGHPGCELWALVLSPWVLVQDRQGSGPA